MLMEGTCRAWKERIDCGWDKDAFDAVNSLSPAARSKMGGSSWNNSLVGESCVTVLDRLWELVAAEAMDAASLGGGSFASPPPAPSPLSLPAEDGSSACSERSWSLELAICCKRRARRRSNWGVGYVARSRCGVISRAGECDRPCPDELSAADTADSVRDVRGRLGPASGSAPFVLLAVLVARAVLLPEEDGVGAWGWVDSPGWSVEDAIKRRRR